MASRTQLRLDGEKKDLALLRVQIDREPKEEEPGLEYFQRVSAVRFQRRLSFFLASVGPHAQ
jgi:hypothetical protein